jgi:membrane associated rhomboid family serine protease
MLKQMTLATVPTKPSSDSVTRRICPVTTVVLAVTIFVTLFQFAFPQVLELLKRRPGCLAAGEWWRTVSPLFVHSLGLKHLVFNVAWIAYVGVAAERLFGGARWLIIYFLAGVIGEFAGFAWKPDGAGASLGGCGLIGALCAWVILVRPAERWQFRLSGYLGLLGAAILCAITDLHGPPIFAGALIAAVMILRDKRRSQTPSLTRRSTDYQE